MKHKPTLRAKADELVRNLHEVARRFLLQGRVLQGREGLLTRQEFRVIEEVGNRGACMMRDLAGPVMLSVSSLTGIVDRLVAKRLALREGSEEDRRVVRVVLTAAGRRFYEERRRDRLRMATAMLMSLDVREQDLLLKLFRKIRETVVKSDPGAPAAKEPGSVRVRRSNRRMP